MKVKRIAGSAAAAAGIGMSALLAAAGPAAAFPLAPPPQCDQANPASCQPGPGRGGNGGGQGGAPQAPSSAPQAPRGNAPQSSTPQAPQGKGQRAPQGNGQQVPQGSGQQAPHGNPPANAPQGPQNNGTGHGPQGNPPANAPQGPENNAPPGNGYDNRPNSQPYTPAGRYDRGTDQVGGPRDAPHGFSTPGNGAPPPPPERGRGWNDGPAPGGPPPNWDGPAPAGGWNGPPPPGGWNRQYNGPDRDIAAARLDFGPFNYNGYSAIPVFNPVFGGWGFWFFGVWIPLL